MACERGALTSIKFRHERGEIKTLSRLLRLLPLPGCLYMLFLKLKEGDDANLTIDLILNEGLRKLLHILSKLGFLGINIRNALGFLIYFYRFFDIIIFF
ncbi:hypothetical protein ELAC_0179 [Estrella lausannensis]|uniref:Uncharacterized protein n=1 Tax=Estrella lausannensis TaxID=483423 RepID=A0A0H5E2W1_9BACT|nr:hypothetical protein ELAC_0179 [Estrella lausannensis]